MHKQVIILFGPPGAGKGTQASLLSEKLGLYFFETSKILEREFIEAEKCPETERYVEVEGERFDILKEKESWLKGALCSPPLVTQLVIKNITRIANEGENLILAGSPRTVYEVERVVPALEKLYGKENIKVFLLKISAEITVFRNTHRKICELMRHSILFNKETEKLSLCPLDGSKLMKREGLDDAESIKIRLNEYKERTLPMIDYFKKNGIKVKEIDAEKTVADIFENLLKEIA